MMGSNDGRGVFKRRVASMQLNYGAPTLFLTLTPDPSGSLIVAVWSEAASGQDGLPKKDIMTTVISKNPVLQPHYYTLC
jgi:hypothetical protein